MLFVNHYDELNAKTVDAYYVTPDGKFITYKQKALNAFEIGPKEEEMRCDDWQRLIKKDFKESITYDEYKVDKNLIKKFDDVIKDVPDWHDDK